MLFFAEQFIGYLQETGGHLITLRFTQGRCQRPHKMSSAG